LRIWSAGCASGAEAHSLSIVLRDEFREQTAGWDVSILGTDVNRRLLEQARAGRYENWALRTTPDDIRARCFDAEGSRWRIADRYRRGVGFQYHNRVKHQTPAWLNGLIAFDLVLCRNVMIYFDRSTAAQVVDRLHESMLPGAWLVVGHADHDPNSFRRFDVVSQDGVTIYRKPGEPGATRSVLAAASAPEEAKWESPAESGVDRRQHFAEPAPPGLADEAQQMLGEVRALADQGASVEAETLCAALIEKSPLDPLPHFYQALILEQLGRSDEAERSLRRTLYLDRRLVLAHYHLGLLLQRGGRYPAARQYFENTLALLAVSEDGHAFEHGDGIRVAELRALAEMNLEDL
jgi:chemotaxis protein methyltransferase CheR